MPLDRAHYYSRPSVLRQYHESGQDKTRSDFVLSDGLMPMSTGWEKYRRFHPNEPMTTIIDQDGRGWQLTETQVRVFRMAQGMIDTSYLTMRAMAVQLGVAASTVSRALWKLQAIGLLAFVIGRGRYGGLVMLSRVKGDGLERFRLAAKAKIRRWSQAARERVSRSIFNVAPREPQTKVVGISTTNTMDATLTWSVDDLREAGIL